MDTIFIQIHITGQEKIFLLIWIRDYKWQPLMARLRTGETESPTWSSITQIASSLAKGKLGKNTTVLQGTKGCILKHKFRKQWTIVSLLSILTHSSMYPKGSIYSSSMGKWRVESEWYQGIWKARRQMSRIHIKKNSKRIWPFAHILMYVVLGVKPAYIPEKGFKIHV